MALRDLCDRLHASGYGCVAGYLRKMARDPAYAVDQAARWGDGNVIEYVLGRQGSAGRLVRGGVIEHEFEQPGDAFLSFGRRTTDPCGGRMTTDDRRRRPAGDREGSDGECVGPGNVSQSVGVIPHGDAATRDELKQLIDQLNKALHNTPPGKAEEAEAVAESAKMLVEKATEEKPNKTMIQITGEGLKQAAKNVADVMPTILTIATQIVAMVAKPVV